MIRDEIAINRALKIQITDILDTIRSTLHSAYVQKRQHQSLHFFGCHKETCPKATVNVLTTDDNMAGITAFQQVFGNVSPYLYAYGI